MVGDVGPGNWIWSDHKASWDTDCLVYQLGFGRPRSVFHLSDGISVGSVSSMDTQGEVSGLGAGSSGNAQTAICWIGLRDQHLRALDRRNDTRR